MHELSITQSILDIALDQARNEGVTHITKINVVIGKMTGVVEEYVRFYMRLLSPGTAAEAAKLAVRLVPITMKCKECAESFEVRDSKWACPSCSSTMLDLTGGKELLVESIEVADSGDGTHRSTRC